MPYVGTFGDIDPNYRQRQLQNMGSALQMILAGRERKQAERDAARERDMERFSSMAETFPDAAVTYGESLVAKYGKDMPHLQGMVDSLREQVAIQQQNKAMQAQGRAAGQRWMQEVEQAEKPLREIVANPQDWQAPLLTPGMAEARLPQVPRDVAGRLSFPEREMARVWAQDQGYSFPDAPTPIDPYGQTFPAEVRAHLAGTAGLLPPDVARGVRIDRGLELSAGQEEQSALQREAGRRADVRLDLDRMRQGLAERRLALDREKEARVSRQRSEATTTGVKPAALAKDAATWLVQDTKLLADEWDVGLKELANAADGKVTPDLRESYSTGVKRADAIAALRRAGNEKPSSAQVDAQLARMRQSRASANARPEPLLRAQANLIASKITRELGDEASPELVQQFVEAARAKYIRLVARGLTREQAVRHVLDSTEPR